MSRIRLAGTREGPSRFTATTTGGEAIIRTSVPPFKWWRGLRGRVVLEDYFMARVRERRYGSVAARDSGRRF